MSVIKHEKLVVGVVFLGQIPLILYIDQNALQVSIIAIVLLRILVLPKSAKSLNVFDRVLSKEFLEVRNAKLESIRVFRAWLLG